MIRYRVNKDEKIKIMTQFLIGLGLVVGNIHSYYGLLNVLIFVIWFFSISNIYILLVLRYLVNTGKGKSISEFEPSNRGFLSTYLIYFNIFNLVFFGWFFTALFFIAGVIFESLSDYIIKDYKEQLRIQND